MSSCLFQACTKRITLARHALQLKINGGILANCLSNTVLLNENQDFNFSPSMYLQNIKTQTNWADAVCSVSL